MIPDIPARESDDFDDIDLQLWMAQRKDVEPGRSRIKLYNLHHISIVTPCG